MAASDKIMRRGDSLAGAALDSLLGVWGLSGNCNDLRAGDVQDLFGTKVVPYQRPGATDDFNNANDQPTDSGCTSTATATGAVVEMVSSTSTRTCNVQRDPQACFHYASVAKHFMANSHNPADHSNHLLCPWSSQTGARRWAPDKWNYQHNPWKKWIPKLRGETCQRDEFPFYRFLGHPNPATLQYIRLYVAHRLSRWLLRTPRDQFALVLTIDVL